MTTNDREKLIQLANIINDLCASSKPTAVDLDYDDNAIEMYDDIYKLRESLKAMGFDIN